MPRPNLLHVPAFYHNYINQVKEGNLIQAFKNETLKLTAFLEDIPTEKYNYRYAEGKWTIKEILQHIIDAERIFAYRALRFARKDTTPLAGFDENSFAMHAKAEHRNWNDLIEEYKVVRQSSTLLFTSLDQEQLALSGTANGKSIDVLSIGFIIIGHAMHHLKVIQERYL